MEITNQSYSFTSADDDNTVRDEEGNTYQIPKPSSIKPKPSPKTNVNKVEEKSTPPVKKKEKSNPIQILIQKSNKDKVNIEVPVKIEIPKKGVYKILKDSFDEDIDTEILNLIFEDISINKIKELIKESIKAEIKNHYK